jgi:hypothetical protein
LNTTNMDQNGKVNCNFRRTGRCPENTNAIQFSIDCKFVAYIRDRTVCVRERERESFSVATRDHDAHSSLLRWFSQMPSTTNCG